MSDSGSRGAVRLEFRRTGGLFAGNRLQTSVDSADLSEEERAQVESALERLDVAQLAHRSPLRGEGADLYQYDVTIDRGDGPEHITVDEDQSPPELSSLIAVLERRAEAERGERRS